MTSLRVLIGIGLLASIAACSSSSGAIDDTDGAAVARELGCTSCHVETDTDVAPTLVGLWGSEVELEDGSSITVDRAYVQRSIEMPQADIVAGYGKAMPTIPMSDVTMAALIEYIEGLR